MSNKKDFSTKTVGELFWMLPLTEGKGAEQNRNPRAPDQEATTYNMNTAPSNNRSGTVPRLVLFIINILSFFAGVALIAVGGWMLSSQTYMEALFGSSLYSSAATMLIFCGVGAVIVSLLGGFAAVVLNRRLLKVYGVIVLIIAILVVIGGVVALMMNNQIESSIKAEMIDNMEMYDEDDEIKAAWDDTQNKLECCGVDSWKDWEDVDLSGSGVIPESCCKSDIVTQECVSGESSSFVHVDGCYEQIKDVVGGNVVILAVLGFISFLLLIICIIAAYLLLRAIP